MRTLLDHSLAEIIQLANAPIKLECSECGMTMDAACGCGVAYLAPAERAKRAVEQNPGKSDRAIAEEIGVGHATVSRARKATASRETVETRTGKDGKTRVLPKPKKNAKTKTKSAQAKPRIDLMQAPAGADWVTDQQRWEWSLGNFAGDAVAMRAFWKQEFGDWTKFEVPSAVVTLAKQAAEAWAELVAELSRRADHTARQQQPV